MMPRAVAYELLEHIRHGRIVVQREDAAEVLMEAAFYLGRFVRDTMGSYSNDWDDSAYTLHLATGRPERRPRSRLAVAAAAADREPVEVGR